MGVLVNGKWQVDNSGYANKSGEFVRYKSVFRNWLTKDGSEGPDGQKGHAAEADRYHLYVSYACPWAHRTQIMRELKGLTELIPLSVTHWRMLDRGWTFDHAPGVIPDPVMGAKTIHEIYQNADPNVSAKATVPVLWDKKEQTIVSNESSEIIRMLNTAFDDLGARPGDYYPEHLRPHIDEVNERVYHTVNNGVYRAGFATSQDKYDIAVTDLFDSLDWIEGILSKHPYLVGQELTEADIRLFTTLVRFDAVYHTHFKCNVRRIADYPAIQSYLERLYAMPEIQRTVHIGHAKRHYYESHKFINPHGLVPKGPDLPWLEGPYAIGFV